MSVRQGRRRRVEVVADDDRGIGVREELRSREEVIGGRGEGVLIGATIKLLAHELFGCAVATVPTVMLVAVSPLIS
jgi:hypothetical protein